MIKTSYKFRYPHYRTHRPICQEDFKIYGIVLSGDFFMRLRIRDCREDHDLTQRQIADYLQCDQSLYSKYERGERDVPLHLMVRLADYYNTSIDYLVGRTDEPKPYTK